MSALINLEQVTPINQAPPSALITYLWAPAAYPEQSSWKTTAFYRNFGTFEVELDNFSITFRQGSIVDSTISGKITLPSGFSGDGSDGKSVIQIDGQVVTA